MSFHKLKLGSKKKDSIKPLLSKQQKIFDKNENVIDNLNFGTKLTERKSNLISITDDFNNQIFSAKKAQFQVGPKTDRVHKIQRLQFSSAYEQNNKRGKGEQYHFNYSNSEQNHQYTASQLVDFLNINSEQKKRKDSMEIRSQKIAEESGSVKRHTSRQIHQIKHLNIKQGQLNIFPQQKTKNQKKAKSIQLQQKPLNCQEFSVKVNENVFKSILQVSLNQVKIQKGQNQDQPKIPLKILSNSFKNIQKSQNVHIQPVEERATVLNEKEKQKPTIAQEEANIQNQNQKKQGNKQSIKVQQGKIQNFQNKQIKQSKQASSLIKSSNIQIVIKKQQKQQPRILKEPVSQSKISQPNLTSSPVVAKQPSNIAETQKGATFQSKSKQSSPSGQKSTINFSDQQFISSPTKGKLNYKPINQIQLTILQHNKTLTQQVQKLRRQRDQLLFSNKRYQVQLLQSNCKDYYERQMSRLKNQVESLQYSQEQLKHNNFILQNKCKQLQSSQQISKKEMKKLLKDFQQIKIQSTKQKYQLKEKGSSLQQIIKQLQERNTDLSSKFEEYYKKYYDIQRQYKIKTQQQLTAKKQCQILQTKIFNIEKTKNEKLKVYENQIQKYTNLASNVENDFRNFKRQSEAQTDGLKQNIKQLNLKRQSQVLLISSRTKTLEKHNNIIEAELQVVRLQQTVKELELQIQKRSELIRQLNHKVDAMISMVDYEDLRKQYERVCQNKLVQTQMYQKEILQLNRQNEELRKKLQENQHQLKQRQNIVSNISKKSSSHKSEGMLQKQNFQQILKQQILQCENLRQQIFSKSQLLFQSKQQNQQLKIKHQSLRNQQQILKKQFTSHQNNSKIKKQILEQQLSGQVQSIKRKLTVLQKRFESKIKQNKEKEQFIQNYIIGKASNQNDANYLIKQLERVFLENEKQTNVMAN